MKLRKNEMISPKSFFLSSVENKKYPREKLVVSHVDI